MRLILTLLLITLLAFTCFFRTGCSPEAQAVNVMLAESYSFTTIDGLKVTVISPAAGATSVATNAPIVCDVVHDLPIQSITMAVTADGANIAGSLVVTNRLLGGKHVVWTPANNYPKMTKIDWTIEATVDNGQ